MGLRPLRHPAGHQRLVRGRRNFGPALRSRVAERCRRAEGRRNRGVAPEPDPGRIWPPRDAPPDHVPLASLPPPTTASRCRRP